MSKRERNEGNNAINTYTSKDGSDNKVYRTSGRIRKIGNSRGILLNAGLLKELGVADDSEVNIIAENGSIIITPLTNSRKINTDLSSWEMQFKSAIDNGDKPEGDFFDGMENKFDKEEWQ